MPQSGLLGRRIIEIKIVGADRAKAIIKSLHNELLKGEPIIARYQRRMNNAFGVMEQRAMRFQRVLARTKLPNVGNTQIAPPAVNPGVGLGRGAIGGIAGMAAAGVTIGTYKSIQIAADMEEALLNVAKTTGMAGRELKAFETNILDLGSSMAGVSNKELLEIAAVAGQLGIKGSENIIEFTRTVAQMAATSDMSAEQAANAFAQVLNVFQKAPEEAANLGAVWTRLAAQSVATEGNLADLTLRIAGAGNTAGLTADQIAALAAALMDAGAGAEVGGTAMSQVLTKMLTETEAFAKVAGVSVEEFANTVEERPVKALEMFLEGLSRLEKSRAVEALKEIGFEGHRVTSTLLKASQVTDQFQKHLAAAAKESQRPTALEGEYQVQSTGANKRAQRAANERERMMKTYGDQMLDADKRFIEGRRAIMQGIREDLEASAKGSAAFGGAGVMNRMKNADTRMAQFDRLIQNKEAIRTEEGNYQNAGGIVDRIKAAQKIVERIDKALAEAPVWLGPKDEDPTIKLHEKRSQWRKTIDELKEAQADLDKAFDTLLSPLGVNFSKLTKRREIADANGKGYTPDRKDIDAASEGVGKKAGELLKKLDDAADHMGQVIQNRLRDAARSIFGKSGLFETMEKSKERQQGIEDAAMALQEQRKMRKEEFQPQMLGLRENFNRIQMGALKPEPKLADDLKALFSEKLPDKKVVEEIKQAVVSGMLDVRNGKVVFVGN